MLEIIVLVIVVGGIATLARGRGANPIIVGTIAVGGWVLIDFGGLFFIPAGQGRLLLIIAAWAWIGAVTVFVRFVIGAGHLKPDGKWNCSNCNYLNNSSSVICEACQQPWRAHDRVTVH